MQTNQYNEKYLTEEQMLEETKKLDMVVKLGCELRYENLRYVIEVLTEEKEERDEKRNVI
jgi:tagatose-1,6-bisphosphate aldolase